MVKMNSLLKGVFGFFLVALIVFISLQFVLATHVNSPDVITVDKNQPYQYNITINNTNDGGVGGNITLVNITLPPTFSYIFSYAGTDNGTNTNSTVRNISITNTIYWFNYTKGIINSSANSSLFWFNASVSTAGTYSINITTLNSTGTNHTTALTVTVIDGAPTITVVYPLNGSAYSNNTVNFTVSAVDAAGNISACWTQINSSTNVTMSRSGNTFNYTNITMLDGNYLYRIYCNDSWNNVNGNVSVNFTIDTIAPYAVNYTSMSTAQTSLGFNISISDADSGVSSSCVVNRSYSSLATVSGTGAVQNISDSGLTCATTYLYNVTCNDSAGNINRTSVSYATSACDVVADSPGGGEVVAPSFWTTSYVLTDSQVAEGFNRMLPMKGRFKFNFAGSEHSMGVVALTSTTATVNVSSTPQQKIMSTGEEWKVDLTSDGYYDISVKLVGILNNQANVTMIGIHEKVVVPQPENPSVGEQVQNAVDNVVETVTGKNGGISPWLWVLWLVLVVALILVVVNMIRKKQKRRRYYLFGY